MTRSKLMKLFLCCFFAGVMVGSVLVWWMAFVAIMAAFVVLMVRRGPFFAMICLIAMLIGFFRIIVSFPSFGSGDLGFYRDIGGAIRLQGVVTAQPEIRNDAQYIILEARSISFRDDIEVSGKVLLKLDRFPEYDYGDVLELYGLLGKPAEFDSFSYADYLAKDGIFVVMYGPRVKLLEKDGFVSGWRLLYAIKSFVSRRIQTLFTEPGSGIVLGLLLGLRSSIPQEILDNFQRSGLTHILAISGYNITLLITIVGAFLKSGSRRLRFAATWMAIAFFALLTGLSASVVRASIMGALAVFTLFQGRKADGILILLLSGFFMVLVSPRILVWDVSFQLSFVSTLGLMMIMPVWEKHLQKMPPLLAEGLPVTLAATIFTTPVALYHFGTFSVISPLANLIFLPFIPLIMFFSFLALASSILLLPITFLWVGAAWVLLSVFLWGVQITASIPLAYLKISDFPWWAAAVYYFVVMKIILSRTPRSEPSGSNYPARASLPLSTEKCEKRMK